MADEHVHEWRQVWVVAQNVGTNYVEQVALPEAGYYYCVHCLRLNTGGPAAEVR